MKKLLIVVLLIVGLLIPAVSADTVSIPLSDYDVKSYSYKSLDSGPSGSAKRIFTEYLNFDIYNIQEHPNLKTLYVRFQADRPSNITLLKKYDSKKQPVEFYLGSNKIGHGTVAYNAFYNTIGALYELQFWIDIIEWDVSGLTGTQQIIVTTEPNSPLRTLEMWYYTKETPIPTESTPASFYRVGSTGRLKGHYIVNDIYQWSNTVNIDDNEISIVRDGDYSVLNVSSKLGEISDTGFEDRTIYVLPPLSWEVTNSRGTIYNGTYGDDLGDPDESGVTVYVKNSQTGALIANSHIVIDALVNGEYYTVTNRTEPSGIFTITLQPTGGGQPNPDGYRLIVTADGYINPMPEINFTLGEYRKYFECFLDPIAGGPADENKTFIDFFVRDMSSNPISGATVKFGKYTLITNSAGYTVFEVDKNSNYSWTVSKSGYGPLTGNAVIGDAPRHTINTVLAPIVTPTVTTPIPTSPPIGPTPTMTAPTGEPVSNLLDWFAAHFGMILGGGVEIGKIFMWLCFTVPVGVYVGKQAKAGAAGFMAGAGIVTLFFVLIGWVPIWLLVLLALIIGLLYAKVFSNPDNGGGR